ncbi:hypothetical protein P2G88_14880 [Aliiglaciecola sp. CAU 1673]|uniref:hypothetical protein n=1 Tax=Aliiglaciecola sp. CAU 1673 TaxID=3032595 RepID=UPI0023D98DA0|nr:hypothetical protein [Aliiglaciecola sp. CAU 1673]MDF2179535.1 hypothetical protein [Aliiglaciecola sp. CAU 1673]
MPSDLMFPILPKEGKTSPLEEEFKVEQVAKEAKIRSLIEEDEGLSAQEREAREEMQKKDKEKQKKQKQAGSTKAETPVADGENKAGPGHLDVYI